MENTLDEFIEQNDKILDWHYNHKNNNTSPYAMNFEEVYQVISYFEDDSGYKYQETDSVFTDLYRAIQRRMWLEELSKNKPERKGLKYFLSGNADSIDYILGKFEFIKGAVIQKQVLM